MLWIWGNLSLLQLQRENLHNRACSPWKCTPFGACGTTFPPEGELFPLLQNEQLKLAQGEASLELPPPGEAPRSGDRGAFPRARRRGLPVFPARQGGCKGFIKNGAEGAHHNPLNPLNPRGVSRVLNKKYLYTLKDKIE